MRLIHLLIMAFSLFSCHPNQKTAARTGDLIAFESHGCRGWCPVYKLLFRNNGTAVYEGIRNTVKAGTTEFKITKEELSRLQRATDAANVWQYPEQIPSNIADAPGGIITVFRGSAQKRVSGTVDRPKPLLELEALMQALADAQDLDVKTGVNPNEIPVTSRSEVIVTLKKEVNAGNWIARFGEIKLRLVRRISAENTWLVAFDPAQITEKTLIEMLKSTEEVLEVQPNKAVEERH